jgi:hypothetical protein
LLILGFWFQVSGCARQANRKIGSGHVPALKLLHMARVLNVHRGLCPSLRPLRLLPLLLAALFCKFIINSSFFYAVFLNCL